MQISAQAPALSVLFRSLHLNAFLAFPDVKEPWERAVYVSVYLFPSFDVERRVHSRYFTDYDYVLELRYFFSGLVGVMLVGWGSLKADWAHVVVIAVVDVCLFLVLETSFQFFPSSLRVNSECRAFAMELERDARLPGSAKVPIQEVEPKDECVVPCEGAE